MGFFSRLLGLDDSIGQAGRAGDDSRPDRSAEGSSEEIFEKQVEAILEKVRPALLADGGDIRLVSVSGRSAKVRLLGACQGCHSATLTLQLGIEKRLRDEIPGFEDLIPV